MRRLEKPKTRTQNEMYIALKNNIKNIISKKVYNEIIQICRYQELYGANWYENMQYDHRLFYQMKSNILAFEG